MKALLIIDTQNDFMPGGALEVPDGDIIVPVINRLQPYFEVVAATQDRHQQSHVSFASNHHGKNPFDKLKLQGIEQKLWPDHCVQGTKGAMFHPDLETNRITAVFRKGMNREVDSYSGLYDNRHLVSTGLSGYLKERGCNDLYFCGLAADICVYYTIIDALKEGFSAALIEDATQPLSKVAFTGLKKDLREGGVRIMSSRQMLM